MSLDSVIEPIMHSPRLPEIFGKIESRLRNEASRRKKFYQDMTEQEKIEFIDGEVVLHSPARRSHLSICHNLAKLIGAHVSIHQLGELMVEKCLVVFPRNDYEPDIVFFTAEKAAKFTPNTMRFPVPDFIVEVLSESTEARDRGVKFEDYAANGVGEYWIVDPELRVVEQYLLRGDEYTLALKSGSGEIASTVIPNLRLPIAAFFDSGENLKALRDMMSAEKA